MSNKDVAQRLVDFVDNCSLKRVPPFLGTMYYAVRMGTELTDDQARHVSYLLDKFPLPPAQRPARSSGSQ
jgi:hypothetical protein